MPDNLHAKWGEPDGLDLEIQNLSGWNETSSPTRCIRGKTPTSRRRRKPKQCSTIESEAAKDR